VGNDNPDQQRVLDEGGGGLCVPLAPDDFAHAVCRLLADETLRRAMASSGQSYVLARRSYELLAETVASKYADVLGRRR
jgi:glycosyltransferase involved in cell wall biosynthesis